MGEILCDDDFNCIWSLQSHTNPTSETSDSLTTNTMVNSTQNLWSCPNAFNLNNNSNKPDPFEILFGTKSHMSTQLDSGIVSSQSQHHHNDLIDMSNEELCRRLADLLKKPSLEKDERHCLQQVFNLVQQLDALTPRSGPNSLNVYSSSDEANSLDLVKSRISDYSSASSTSTASNRSAYDNNSAILTKVNTSNSSNLSTPSRIVATVQPYNSSLQLAPQNTPTDSPRKVRYQPWQTNSLSESGVFVESDFYSDINENNVCTQTDFEDSGIAHYSTHHIFNSNCPTKKVPVQQQNSANLTDQKRLLYYKERVEILERKIIIYESSGDVQAKRLAERLQREIQLEKEVTELRDRVEFLEGENSNLEEEKCEFEEAENDTRLRLQRLEVELEILSQRNVELEMSREAQSAKYKDCHSEGLILREDLAASETQIRHLEEDKQKVKENLEFLHNTLPLLLIYNTYCTLVQVYDSNYRIDSVEISGMGNQGSNMNLVNSPTCSSHGKFKNDLSQAPDPCTCHEKELQNLKEEVKCLRHQIKELNTRYYAALESADSHWVDLEREYKEREEQFRTKEICLKQKIQKLQDCLKDDSRSANEKICQLEEAEEGLKTCLVKVSKEHQKLQQDHNLMMVEFDRFKEQHEQVRDQQKPLTEALEWEKKRNKALSDELAFMRKLQQETESQTKKDLESASDKMFDLKKDFLHSEVTNGELREEVATLEIQIQNLEKALQESEEKIRCLTDEIRTKDEICQKLEKRLERTEGYSLADELGDSPSKRFKREEVKDLKTANKGLGQVLRDMEECEQMLPSQKQFKTIARDVKKLADGLLQGDTSEEEPQIPNFKSKSTENILNDNLSSEMIKQNSEEPKQEDNFSEKFYRNNTDNDITVATVLIPHLKFNESIMPSCFQKKAICEVPSELRKLANPAKPKTPLLDSKNQSNKTLPRLRVNRKEKRNTKNGVTRRRVSSSFQLKVNHMVTRLFNDTSSLIYQDGSKLAVNRSEILQRNISYTSFHSLHEEINESIGNTSMMHKELDVSVESEMKNITKEVASNTAIEKSDFGIQVNDEIALKLQLLTMPKHIRCLLDLLRSADTNTKFLLNSSVLNMKICLRWKSDTEFQYGLETLATFVSSLSCSEDLSCACLKSYEDFVSVMNCLQALEELFKPNKIAMLKNIETNINERLMIFHNQQKESEFYCTVYYPVERKCGSSFAQMLKNV